LIHKPDKLFITENNKIIDWFKYKKIYKMNTKFTGNKYENISLPLIENIT
jgi:hypothetical protein